MTKFIISLGDQCHQRLEQEAKTRDITVQQLIRAVIVPFWIKENIGRQNEVATIAPVQRSSGYLPYRSQPLEPPIARLRT